MICFHLFQHADYEDKSRKRWLDFGGIFKIIQIYERNDGGNKMQVTTLTYSSNCSIFSAKKLETKSTAKNQENLKNGKLRFRLNIDLRKGKEDSWLNAMKTKIAFVKGRLNFSSKSATAANVHLMESLLDNWLKNNHTTVDIIYYLRNLLVSGVFYEF